MKKLYTGYLCKIGLILLLLINTVILSSLSLKASLFLRVEHGLIATEAPLSKLTLERTKSTNIFEGCGLISSLPCESITVTLPFNLSFNTPVAGTISDRAGEGTGFTLVDAYSGTRLLADGTPGNNDFPGYEGTKLTLAGGHLQIASNKGISYLANNNQINALGVKFESGSKYQVETVLINPFNGTSAQQAGIWIGQNDKSFLKLVVVGNKLEFRRELNDISGNNDVRVTGAINNLSTSAVSLRLIVDPATNTAEAFYSLDGTNFTNVGASYATSVLSISGMNLTGGTTLAGIFATHRNASSSVTYTFDHFGIGTSASEPEPTPSGCPPVSTLPCSALQVSLPVNLTFNQAQANTLTDRNNQGIGLTLVDTYSGTRLSADGSAANSDVPGYDASKLMLGAGRLQLVSNKGISYLGNNNQINALGVKFNSQSRYRVETVLISPFNGSSAQQAGIWIGQNDKTFLKLVAVGNKLEFRKEVNDVSATADTRVTGTISNLNTSTVSLRLVVDPATNSAEAFYSIDGINFTNVGVAYGVSSLNISGMNLTGSTAQAGIFATHRNSSTPVTYIFDQFEISTEAEEPTPTGCPPNSTLPCPELLVSLPVNLTFNEPQANTISDNNNQGTGFTMVNVYSGSRLSVDGSPENISVPGYSPSKLSLGAGRLQIVSNKGISYLGNNNQINALGVKFSSVNKYQVKTVLINPFNGGSAQQAGIWIGPNDKTFLKLVAVGNKLEFRKEVNDVSATSDTRVTEVISGLNNQTVHLVIVIDPGINTAEAFYSIDGSNYVNVGAAYPDASLSIGSMGLTGSTTFAGIFATHRGSSTPVTYTFDNFSVDPQITSTEGQLAFSPTTLNYTVLKGGTIRSQSSRLSASSGSPAVNLFKTEADWFTLPQQPALNDIVIGNSHINSNLPAGSYKVTVTAVASGYASAELEINLTVVEPQPTKMVTINFQDAKTIPPPGSFRDYGQPYGVKTGEYQDINQSYGWKKRSDGTLLDLTKNGRNRLVPDDVLLATLLHMQADDIAGSFTGTKVEGFWEYKTPNGDYDVTVSVGDANIGADVESHTINAEGVNIISGFIPSGDHGGATRFETITKTVTITDGALTLTADGGVNTKINSVKFVPVTPYIFWARTTHNLLLEQNDMNTQTFSIGIGNSIDGPATYTLSASYEPGAAGWLSFNASHSSNQPNLTFNYSAANTLSPGIYTANVTAAASGFTSRSFTIQLRVVDPNRPYVISSSPANGALNVSVNTVSVAANKLFVPAVAGFKGGVDNSTISASSVKLFKIQNGNSIEITGVVQGTGGGDVISFSPSFGLEPFSAYRFVITNEVKSYSGASFNPFESSFMTGPLPRDSTNILNVKFKKIPVPGTQNTMYSSLAIGPDDKFYALRLDGFIEKYDINHSDGSLTNVRLIETLVNKYGFRSAVGIAFDPSSTVTNVKVWISHCSSGLTAAPEFDGNISLLTGPNLENEQLIITKLPRSTRDHLVNSLTFGPDGALYFNQGSNSSMGSYDALWQRDESLLSAAVLRLDLEKLAAVSLPLNVQTTADQNIINNAPSNSRLMSDGTYNPYSTISPLTIYASGVRNAYDLVWHTNGQLYVPTNGSGGGGNSPASVTGTRRPDGSFYSTPLIPATQNVQVQPDLLFRVNPLKSVGYYGHPNPTRGQYVPFRGYLDNPNYPTSVGPDRSYRGNSFDFGLNISANGSIEYKSNVFGGRLKGKLIVCRFAGGGDLIVLEPGSMTKDPDINSAEDDDRIYNIIKAATGSGNNGMEGMSAFVNPLDVIEDVTNGNLYVIEFNWNGDPNLTSQITLLKVDEEGLNATPVVVASSETPLNAIHDSRLLPEEASMKIYPNPATENKIHLELRNYKSRENISIVIYDMLGRIIKQAKSITNDEGALTSELPLNNAHNNQYYVMMVNSMTGMKVLKFFVQ